MITLLFVEDDAVVAHVYRSKLMREGFGVEVAENGLVALKKLAMVKPDILVLDLMMPKLSGVDVLRYVRSSPGLKKTPVIILSNAQMTQLAQDAAAIGVEGTLLKASCTPSQLIAMINDILSGKGVESDPSSRLGVEAPPTKPQP